MPEWDLNKGWTKQPVTFFEALGFSSAKIQWPRLKPSLPVTASSSGSGGSSSGSGSGKGSGKSPPMPSSTSAQANRALGQKMAAAAPYNWTGAQWDALNNIVMAESGWDDTIANPGSGAYGIPQALPGSKMASAGADWRTNPATQIKWLLLYIRQRYGTPEAAWQFHLAHGWY